jgi:hypothetical protein
MFRSPLEAERRETVSEFPKNIEQAEANKKYKIKVRLDYRGLPRRARFFFGGKGSREVAEELRQQQAAIWRNVPMQGVRIEDTDYFDLYSVYDEIEDELLFYAPLEIKATVDSLEECVRFTSRDEFRRIEILEPVQVTLTGRELERIFFRFSEALKQRIRVQELE